MASIKELQSIPEYPTAHEWAARINTAPHSLVGKLVQSEVDALTQIPEYDGDRDAHYEYGQERGDFGRYDFVGGGSVTSDRPLEYVEDKLKGMVVGEGVGHTIFLYTTESDDAMLFTLRFTMRRRARGHNLPLTFRFELPKNEGETFLAQANIQPSLPAEIFFERYPIFFPESKEIASKRDQEEKVLLHSRSVVYAFDAGKSLALESSDLQFQISRLRFQIKMVEDSDGGDDAISPDDEQAVEAFVQASLAQEREFEKDRQEFYKRTEGPAALRWFREIRKRFGSRQ